jgi:16S rRNA (cytosine967-C5)-methyltransferase
VSPTAKRAAGTSIGAPACGRRSGAAPARACAYAVLRRVFEDGAWADRALHAQTRELDARDRALAMRLSYGAVQRRGTLDHLIELLAGRPPERLDAPLLAALRLGLYELLYLDGAPDRAVVADAVELAKANSRGAAHGLVNAVLRRATREGAGLLDALTDETPERAAVRHSHPEWVARLLWEALGATDARALMACDNEPGEVALRTNTLVTDARTLARALAAGEAPADAGSTGGGPVRTRTDSEIPEALVLEGPFDAHASKLWHEGAFVAQSRAAMLVARAVAPEPGERVLDLCAAPGGKSTHLAALMDGRGEVVAVERNPRRAAELERTCRRLRADSVRVEVADAALARPTGGGSTDRGSTAHGSSSGSEAPFHRVLVDPPCSGLGTLQARPDLRWRVTPGHVQQMARTQAAILAAGAAAVCPGGVLVYSTCTISPTENERQIVAFLDSHPDFTLDDLGAELTRCAHPSASRCVLTLPHRDGTAGFFIARLRRG